MSSQRYADVFGRLAKAGEGAFVPFTVLGDPDPETSLAVMEAFAAGGADMLELGIPFSDPIADGPTIQGADQRALDAGTTPQGALDLVAEFRKRHPEHPIGLLVYANLVARGGVEAFCGRLSRAGVDSILVADLPMEEGRSLRRAADAAGVGSVAMVTPMTDSRRLAKVTALPAPYIYVVSRVGITGKDASLAASAAPLLRRLRRVSSTPTLLGFGIGQPADVRSAVALGASGAISGSAAVEIIARHAGRGALTRGRRAALSTDLREFVAAMKSATR
ncbi:MAG: tryptophan synthase subunit alpha [Candidatus Latescibacteria bacterium]|nr:tryptophan synthase subunit alpha [bacterium]MCB9516491.1 tryptophan synthase subunit alpha [Candidatus Latescibacterota bacterium]